MSVTHPPESSAYVNLIAAAEAMFRAYQEDIYNSEPNALYEAISKAKLETCSTIRQATPLPAVKLCPECGDSSPLPECSECGGYPFRPCEGEQA